MRGVSFTTQLGLLARRSISRTFRDPGGVAPAVLFPLILFAIVSAGLEKATDVKGFPTHTILDLRADDRVRERGDGDDREHGPGDRDGRRERVHQPPGSDADARAALIAAQLAGALLLGVLQAVVFLGIG